MSISEEVLYGYGGGTYTRDELQVVVEVEAANTVEPERAWVGGKFDFNDWLAEAVMSDLVTRIDL